MNTEKHIGLLMFSVILVIVLCLFGCDLFKIESGVGKWKMYVKSDVYEDPDTYIPTLEDFGNYVGLVLDSTVLINKEDKKVGTRWKRWFTMDLSTFHWNLTRN